jgi:hypothetical protein
MVILQGGMKCFLKLDKKPYRLRHNIMSFCGYISIESVL